jgi:hypothetical protein
MIYHLGGFKFKPEATQEQIDHAFSELRKMVGQIPGLLKIEHGPHVSDEGLDEGLEYVFLMQFESFEARDAYLPHPVHMERVDLFGKILERPVVLDFQPTPECTASL